MQFTVSCSVLLYTAITVLFEFTLYLFLENGVDGLLRVVLVVVRRCWIVLRFRDVWAGGCCGNCRGRPAVGSNILRTGRLIICRWRSSVVVGVWKWRSSGGTLFLVDVIDVETDAGIGRCTVETQHRSRLSAYHTHSYISRRSSSDTSFKLRYHG